MLSLLLDLGVGLEKSYIDLVHLAGRLNSPTIKFLGHAKGLGLMDEVGGSSRQDKLCIRILKSPSLWVLLKYLLVLSIPS